MYVCMYDVHLSISHVYNGISFCDRNTKIRIRTKNIIYEKCSSVCNAPVNVKPQGGAAGHTQEI